MPRQPRDRLGDQHDDGDVFCRVALPRCQLFKVLLFSPRPVGFLSREFPLMHVDAHTRTYWLGACSHHYSPVSDA